MNYELKEGEAMLIAGISKRTQNANGKAAQDIGALFDWFFSENLKERIPNKLDEALYTVYCQYEGDQNQPYMAMLGCRVSTEIGIPPEFEVRSFFPGTYAVYTSRGPLPDAVVRTWEEIHATTEYKRALMCDFDRYDERSVNPADAIVETWVSIRPK